MVRELLSDVVVKARRAFRAARSGPSFPEARRPLPFADARIERLVDAPIIAAGMLPGHDGGNINGPSLIRVPDWLPNPLGRYYLYFAHHAGGYIRLAYANSLTGPWTAYRPGTLRVDQTIGRLVPASMIRGTQHVASPDVHADDQRQEIRMYFHCCAYAGGDPMDRASYRQLSFVARSRDGLNFEAGTECLGPSYFRVFQWNGMHYALSMPGLILRSIDGLGGFVKGPTLFTPDMRHAAVAVRGSTLFVFYSIAGDCPERIVLSKIDLRPDWMHWRESPPEVVLEPARPWEGAALPMRPSRRGTARRPVRELRDPAFFSEDGTEHLLYSIAGEHGIGIARIVL